MIPRHIALPVPFSTIAQNSCRTYILISIIFYRYSIPFLVLLSLGASLSSLIAIVYRYCCIALQSPTYNPHGMRALPRDVCTISSPGMDHVRYQQRTTDDELITKGAHHPFLLTPHSISNALEGQACREHDAQKTMALRCYTWPILRTAINSTWVRIPLSPYTRTFRWKKEKSFRAQGHICPRLLLLQLTYLCTTTCSDALDHRLVLARNTLSSNVSCEV